MTTRRPRKGMGKVSKGSVDATNKELADEEAALLQRTDIDWEALRPQVADQETYSALIEAVAESTRKNEDLAMLKARLQKLGAAGVTVARRVVSLLR